MTLDANTSVYFAIHPNAELPLLPAADPKKSFALNTRQISLTEYSMEREKKKKIGLIHFDTYLSNEDKTNRNMF